MTRRFKKMDGVFAFHIQYRPKNTYALSLLHFNMSLLQIKKFNGTLNGSN